MDRRRLLKGGAAVAGAGGVALLQEGCAHQAPLVGPESAMPLPEQRLIDQVVTSMDDRLAWIDRRQLDTDLAPPVPADASPEVQERAERHGRLFRQSMRTLYVTGRFIDLPDEVKMHPAVQARVFDAQADMDDAVLGTTAMLESLRPEDHKMIQATLRTQPELGEKLAMLMDEPARDDGIPFKRRLSVRTSTLSLTERMKAQSPALTIDPMVRRVRKLATHPQTGTGTSRLMAAKMGEEAFWAHQKRLAELGARWERQLAQAGPGWPRPHDEKTLRPAPKSASPAAPAPATQPGTPAGAAPPSSRGQGTLRIGGYVMGFGAASLGLGVVFAGLDATWPALIFGVTVGPILLIIGLVILLVGGIQLAME